MAGGNILSPHPSPHHTHSPADLDVQMTHLLMLNQWVLKLELRHAHAYERISYTSSACAAICIQARRAITLGYCRVEAERCVVWAC